MNISETRKSGTVINRSALGLFEGKKIDCIIFGFCISAFVAALFFPYIASADSEGFLSIQLENDLLGSGDDRFYTHGTKVSFASLEAPPDYLQVFSKILPFYKPGEAVLSGYEIGQTIFTPEDISNPDLIEDDRPYAGWLYFNQGMGHIYQDKGDREWMNFVGFAVGVVGPAAQAEETQKFIHDITGSDNLEGWSNQLENEPGLDLWYLHKYRRIYNFDEKLQYELGRHFGFMLGNVYTLGATGIMFRYGTHLKSDIGPPSIAPGFSGTPAFNPTMESHWYLFAGFELRLMARNIFLDGNTFRESHSVDKNELVGDLQLGFAYHFKDMRLSFVQMFRTREFEEQDEPVQYGAVNLTVFYE